MSLSVTVATAAEIPENGALPYVDAYSAESRAEAELLIQEEMMRFTPSQRVALTNLRFTTEFARVSKGGAIKSFDLSRYQVQPPPANLASDVAAWEEALSNAKAQLEHQLNRLVNLELLQTYGANAHIQANVDLTTQRAHLTARGDKLRAEVEALNKNRKADQLVVANQLRVLASQWDELVSKNMEIQVACAYMEEEIARLRPAAPATST